MPTGASGAVTDDDEAYFSALDALLDPRTFSRYSPRRLVALTQTGLQFAHVVAQRVEDAAVGLHAAGAARPSRRARRCARTASAD
jgi:hypothetical protein